MNGHTSNRYLLTHFKAMYQWAKMEEQQSSDRKDPEYLVMYFKGKADQVVQSAIVLQLISSSEDLEIKNEAD
jgi:hypothetical protein